METLSYCKLMERCLAAEARVVELEQRIATQREYYDGVIADGGKRIAELTAENVALKNFIYNDCMVYKDFMGELDDADKHKPETPATDRIVAAQRSAFVDEAVAKITESGALTFGDCIVALCQLRESVK